MLFFSEKSERIHCATWTEIILMFRFEGLEILSVYLGDFGTSWRASIGTHGTPQREREAYGHIRG